MLEHLAQKSLWGVSANDPYVEAMATQVLSPTYDAYGSTATLNCTGSMIIKSDPIVDEFVEFAGSCHLPLLDVGAGYGVATIPALAQGATVIANDMDERHLLVLRQQTSPEYLERLYLKPGVYPFELDFSAQTLDGMMLRRVIHFLDAGEMSLVIKTAAKWLRAGGCLFIVCMSPYHQYLPQFIDLYNERWQGGIEWPGVITDLRHYKPDLSASVPNFIHVMDERPLAKALNPYFIVRTSRFFDYQPGPILPIHKAFYGLVAERTTYEG